MVAKFCWRLFLIKLRSVFNASMKYLLEKAAWENRWLMLSWAISWSSWASIFSSWFWAIGAHKHHVPPPPTLICILWLPLAIRVSCKNCSTINLHYIIFWSNSIVLFASAARFCALVFVWRCQLVLLRACSFLGGMLAQSTDTSAARAWEKARGATFNVIY